MTDRTALLTEHDILDMGFEWKGSWKSEHELGSALFGFGKHDKREQFVVFERFNNPDANPAIPKEHAERVKWQEWINASDALAEFLPPKEKEELRVYGIDHFTYPYAEREIGDNEPFIPVRMGEFEFKAMRKEARRKV